MTIIFNVSQTHFSLASLHFLAFRSRYLVYNSIWECYVHIIIHIYYMHTFILRSRSIVRTFSLFMYQMSWAWNCILLDVQLEFTVSPTLYSWWRPAICGPSATALPCATRKQFIIFFCSCSYFSLKIIVYDNNEFSL